MRVRNWPPVHLCFDRQMRMQMYFDDLPIWGFVGKVERIGLVSTYYLFTHFHFDVAYNDNRIISIDSSADPKTVRDISFEGEQNVEFTYSVKWVPTVEKVRAALQSCCLLVFAPGHTIVATQVAQRACGCALADLRRVIRRTAGRAAVAHIGKWQLAPPAPF